MAETDRIRSEYARRDQEIPAARYSATAPDVLLAGQELERLLIRALRRAEVLPLQERRLLDVGCGGGGWLVRFENWGARQERLAGLDLIEERVADASRRLPLADIRAGDATALPWEDASFDVVFQSMMFSSILDAGVRARAAAEMARVLAPGGVILWYDFFVADPRNKQVLGMRRGEIARLFEGFDLRLRRATLAPPIARAVVGRSWTLGALLTASRVFDGHYAGTLSRRR